MFKTYTFADYLIDDKKNIEADAEEFGLSDEELTEEELELIYSMYDKYQREEIANFPKGLFRPSSR